MRTGWPGTGLPATCGSEPIAFAPPFGDRQGTRLKMSPADFATCFTLSMARAVMPRWAGDVAATVVWDGEAEAGLADCCGAGVACAAGSCARDCDTGVSNSNAAAAG